MRLSEDQTALMTYAFDAALTGVDDEGYYCETPKPYKPWHVSTVYSLAKRKLVTFTHPCDGVYMVKLTDAGLLAIGKEKPTEDLLIKRREELEVRRAEAVAKRPHYVVKENYGTRNDYWSGCGWSTAHELGCKFANAEVAEKARRQIAADYNHNNLITEAC